MCLDNYLGYTCFSASYDEYGDCITDCDFWYNADGTCVCPSETLDDDGNCVITCETYYDIYDGSCVVCPWGFTYYDYTAEDYYCLSTAICETGFEYNFFDAYDMSYDLYGYFDYSCICESGLWVYSELPA